MTGLACTSVHEATDPKSEIRVFVTGKFGWVFEVRLPNLVGKNIRPCINSQFSILVLVINSCSMDYMAVIDSNLHDT